MALFPMVTGGGTTTNLANKCLNWTGDGNNYSVIDIPLNGQIKLATNGKPTIVFFPDNNSYKSVAWPWGWMIACYTDGTIEPIYSSSYTFDTSKKIYALVAVNAYNEGVKTLTLNS